MKTNKGILSDEELKERAGFWNKKQFRTWGKKEIERSSRFMQSLLNAIKDLDEYDIHAILSKTSYEVSKLPAKSPESIIWSASLKDIEYAISIAPKTFRVKQG